MYNLLSTATVTTVGLASKAVLKSPFCSLQLSGLPTLIAALESTNRKKGQGIVTVSNHISTLDDPLIWGILPASYYLSSNKTRWALGASDIIFTNSVFSTFFRLGQTIETFRGKGVYQPALDTAIKKLDQGGWVHLYGEGKVNQPDTYPIDEFGVASLPRFKWGVGRILMETKVPPVVIPMWLTGFNRLMPEGRPFPYKYIPQPGAQLGVAVGSPIASDELQKVLHSLPDGTLRNLQTQVHSQADIVPNDSDTQYIRAEVTAVIQREVQKLGRKISGKSLSEIEGYT